MASVSATPNVATWRNFRARQLPEVAPWVEKLGRAGYFAKGLVYFIIGGLAFRLAIGAGGEITGSRGAIREIGQQPFGRVLLGLMSLGLLGYFVWRLVQAYKDTEGDGSGAKGILKRIGFVISGLSYAALGCFAGSIALGLASSNRGSGSSSNSATNEAKQTLLHSTAGRYALGIVGVIVIGVALYFIYKAFYAKFMEKYPIGRMSETARKAALHLGRTGLTTRGIAFCIVGGFLVESAWNGTGDQIQGIADALAVLAAQPFGKFLLGTAGFGLVAFGLHTMMLGWYRRFNIRQ